jgi:Peptidase M50B-like
MSEPWKNSESLLANEAPAVIDRMGLNWLVGAAVVTALLWQLPGGDYILYPFTILATWFHEMAHGVMAALLGGNFQQLQIFPNGSGFAAYTFPASWDPIRRALVAAAGPMGPPIAGAALIVASRSYKTASLSLKILGICLLISTLIWVRSLFGFIFVPLLGMIILFLGLKTTIRVQGFAVQFLGVQACVSTYHQLDYLFSETAGRLGASDTAQIQQQLFLPYWFWGGLMAIVSLAILIQSLRVAYRST